MASIIYATKCPNCGRSAIEDHYYKIGEIYTYCLRCGYHYEKTIESSAKDSVEYKEVTSKGYGILTLAKKDGRRERTFFDSPLTDEQMENFQQAYLNDDVNKEKSYMVTFKDGEFTVVLGNPPENFHLSFEDYKVKMFAKYGKPEYDFFVPIEE
ncbi:MAG: hypothetical protein AB2401_04120 [Bacillus sp. (in: firmicutes)]